MKLIKKAQKEEIQFQVGQNILAGKLVPLQNIGYSMEYIPAKVVKVNKVSLNVESKNGNIYRVAKKDCQLFVDF